MPCLNQPNINGTYKNKLAWTWCDRRRLRFSFFNPFCFPEEFQNFVRRLPTFYALNASAIQYFWKMEPSIHQRYKQLQLSTQQLVSKARRIINKIFTLSKRCQTQPKIIMLRERWETEMFSSLPFLYREVNVCLLKYSFNLSIPLCVECFVIRCTVIYIWTHAINECFDIKLRSCWTKLQSQLITWLHPHPYLLYFHKIKTILLLN